MHLCCNLTSENFAAIQMAKSSLKKERAREKKAMEAAKNAQIEKWFSQEEEAAMQRAEEANIHVIIQS